MIKLTRSTSPDPLWLRPAAIVAMTRSQTGGARLQLVNGLTEEVTEEPERVLTIIRGKR